MNYKLEWTLKQKIFEILTTLLVIGIWAQVLTSFQNLPDKIPTNFNFAGNITGYGSKVMLFIMPIICTFMHILLTALCFFPKIWNQPPFLYKPENYMDVLKVEKDLLCSTNFFIVLLFAVILNDMTQCRTLTLVPFLVALILNLANMIFHFIKMYKAGKK